MNHKDRLKILFFPAYYPSEVNPVEGVFIREHAKAASFYNDVVVLYACPDHAPQPKGIKRVSEDIEDGIRTIRVRYGGIILYLWKKLNGGKGKQQISSNSETQAGIISKFISIPLILTSDMLYYWSVFSTFQRLRKEGWKPDIIHAHVYSAGMAAVLLGKLYKIPVIITEHTTNIATHSLNYRQNSIMRFAMNRAKMILPVSDDLGRAIKNYYGIKTKVVTVPNTVNTSLFSFSNKQENASGIKRMLTVCILTPRKGIEYLLEALNLLKEKRNDFKLDIVGDGPNRNEYEMLAKKLALDDIVTFHGRQPEIVSFMKRCDFFVLPSLYENFGVVYIESMASGKPVIATDAGGPREIVNEVVGILVPPKNVGALKEAIEYMLNNYQNYSSEKIAQYANERFNYKSVGKILDNIYQEMVLEDSKLYKKQKWGVSRSGHQLLISPKWTVLDIGSGHDPHPRADILVDRDIGESPHRSGRLTRVDRNRTFILADACSMPFKDKHFDYIIALHIAEHMDNPATFCKELMRVGKRGYIETPSKLCEILLGDPFHQYFVSKKGSSLHFKRKHKNTRVKWFYNIFYYGRNTADHPGILASNKSIHLLLKALNIVIIKIWWLKPVRMVMYTCFEWEQYFNYKVNN